MLLEKLKEYSERIDPTPVMYQQTAIRWMVHIDIDGTYKGCAQTTSEAQGKKKDRGKMYIAPSLIRTSGIKAKLLVDNEDYIWGLNKEGMPEGKALERHEAFKSLIIKCAEETGNKSVMAVKKYYESYRPGVESLPNGFNSGDIITFSVEGVLPFDEPDVREFWARHATDTGNGEDKASGQCLICGRYGPVVGYLPVKTKKIPGGQTSGTSLVSHNASAFESYGLESSFNSPICHECGEAFGKALNNLIEKPETHITIGQLVYVFWTKAKTEFDITTLFMDPKPEYVKKLLAKPLTGERAFEQDEGLFYCAAFSASGGRAVVRDWIVTTLGDVQRNLARYFRTQALISWDGSEGVPLSIKTISKSLAIGKEEAFPNVPKAILRFAFNGGELPLSLLFQAVKRERAEAGVDKKDRKKYWDFVYRNRARMALIKMVLSSRIEYLNREESMEKIDLSNESPAYLCGRLFALIEAVQKAAMPGVNTTVTDRFYGTASTAPASVFGWLLNKGCQNHLAKLRKDKPGACFSLDEDLKEIASRLKTFPRTLNLEEQGLFALGFYHQKAHRSAVAAERKAKITEELAAE